MLQKYVGTKIVDAEPHTLTVETNGHPAGTEGYRVVYENGYESWSPKAVFEGAYRAVTEMTFADAIGLLQQGQKIARRIWPSVFTHVTMGQAQVRPAEYDELPAALKEEIDTPAFEYTDGTYKGEGEPVVYLDWLFNHVDMQATDWYVWTQAAADIAYEEEANNAPA